MKSPLLKDGPVSGYQFGDGLVVAGNIIGDEIDDKIDNLISSFGLVDEEKEILNYICGVVTMSFDVNNQVLEASSYKTYTKDEFYNLLTGLGVDKIKKIIEHNLFIFTSLKEVEKVIKESEPDFRSTYAFRNVYISYLKEAFSGARCIIKL
ncbi:BTA121 domain-containing protein surface lipoprotein [Borrelia persica]|uniref:BTA121 domain-containing protein surface lipoprotein n=1 Tax=Borrelia persica TaxID=44448 RepID=UPI000463EDB9|nr:hypothetical protein [Borrelia persica]